ncbi:integrase core domain-containing protein [Bradyrhizobium sp. USDA 4541]|uniref:integrase core domain-containing protein n=1 Tax=Bradyrhizobium sp. USDA 4541 TaxID=2817704 RepID=UPI0035C737E5
MVRPNASFKPACENGPTRGAYKTSTERAAELPRWLHCYNWHRPHGSIGSKPSISRLRSLGTTS